MSALKQAARKRIRRTVPAAIIIIAGILTLSACQALLMPDPASSSSTTAAATGSVSLSWTASAGPSVTGYKVFWGTSSGTYTQSVDVGNVTSYTLKGLSPATRYYIVVAAYNSAGNSSYSNEVTCH